MHNITAVIQAGGLGTRMKSLTHDIIPKPMLELNGKPLLTRQIENLVRYGIKDIILIIGHLGHKIREYYKNGEAFGINISYIEEKEPLGSAGALFLLKDLLGDNDIVLIYGDLMFDIDLERMISFHRSKRALITLLAHPNSHPYDSDLLLIDSENRVTGIDSKNSNRSYWYRNIVNAGIYIINNSICRSLDKCEKLDLERDIILPHVSNGNVFGYCTSEYVKDAGTPDRFYSVEEDIQKGLPERKCLKNKQKAIFLDRDGTINRYRGLVYDEDAFELEDMVNDAIRLINKSGFLAIVVTNQPVVARGLCDLKDVERIHMKMETLLGREGAYLDDLIFCPHHPDKGYPEENPVYKIKCKCRKPDVGMIESMMSIHNIDIEKSWIIGDSTVDIMTGKNAGLHTALVMTGQAGKDGKYDVKPDIVCKSLLEAVERIL